MDYSKKLMAILLIMAAAFAMDSCKSDPCKDIACVNGECVDGDCVCESGFGGTLCDQKICDDSVCEFGDCNNGVCECDEGFDGETCGNEIPPSVIHIKQIIVTGFPTEKKNGAPWDEDTTAAAPDLTVIFETEEGNVLFKTLDSHPEAVLGNRYSFDCDINIGVLATNHKILLYDEDNNSSNDFMDQTTFNIWKHARGTRFASETPELVGDAGTGKFVFVVEYDH